MWIEFPFKYTPCLESKGKTASKNEFVLLSNPKWLKKHFKQSKSHQACPTLVSVLLNIKFFQTILLF